MSPENTIATAPHTSPWVCGTGPAQPAGNQHQQSTLATICTQYGCTPLTSIGCQPAGNQPYTLHGATLCTQVGGCPPPAAGAAQPQINTVFTTCTQPIVCQPQHNVSVPPHCPTVYPMCPPQTNTLAGGVPAQPQGQAYTVGCPPAAQPNQLVSVPPHCPTVAPMCPPPAAGGQAQPQFPTWPIGQCTVGVLTAVAGCSPQGPVQVPTLPVVQCTVGAVTAIAGCGPQAQAQGAGYTQNIQCLTGTTPVAGNQAQAQGSYYTQQCGGQPAQAQGGYPAEQSTGVGATQGFWCHTMSWYTCRGSEQAQGIAQTLVGCVVQPHNTLIGCPATQHVATCGTIAGYTHNPPMCPPPAAGPIHNPFTQHPYQCGTTMTGALPICFAGGQGQGSPANVGGNPAPGTPPTQLLGCTTVTSNPTATAPPTNIPGCTGVTGTPATVAHTHLMGCTTVTSAPAQAQTIGWTGVQYCTVLPPTISQSGGCAPANAGGQAQAQTQFPTIPPTVCAVTVVAGCGHVTGIPYVC